MRSTITSNGSPRITRGRGALAEALHEAGVPVDLDQVETNFVQIDAAQLGLSRSEALARLAAGGRWALRDDPPDGDARGHAPRRDGHGHRGRRRGIVPEALLAGVAA